MLGGLHYFHFTAAKFNHDVIQLPLWGLAGYAFHASLRRGRLAHWLLLGLVIGLALWAKYFVVVLAAPLALFLLLDRDARRSLATPGPWLPPPPPRAGPWAPPPLVLPRPCPSPFLFRPPAPP